MFSIVIPVYNKEPHIERCINTVLMQTYQNFEMLLVCDPSSDKSTEIVCRYSDNEKVNIFHRDQPGPGGYAARNLGIKHARFNWVCFLDADDEWLPNHLEYLFNSINMYPNYKVFGTGWIVDNGLITKLDKLSSKLNIDANLCNELSLTDYLGYEVKAWRPLWTSASCIDRNILLRAGGFPEGKINMGGDVDTWLRSVFYAGGMVRLGICSSIYHVDSVNMVTKSALINPELHIQTYQVLTSAIQLNKKIKKLLKLRVNKLVLYAWKHNTRIGYKCPFKIYKHLFCSVQPMKCILITLLDYIIPLKIKSRILKR